MIADLTKTAKSPGGISLFTDANKTEYKSTYQLLKDISEIYDDLTDKQQAELLEKLAGKRGGQVLAGILSDFSEVERAMSEIEQSAGSADKEMSIVEETLTFKANALKQVWIDLLTEMADRGTIGKLVDALTDLSEVLSAIISNKVGLVSIFSIISGTILTRKFGGLSDFIKQTKELSAIQKMTGNGSLLNILGLGWQSFKGNSLDTDSLTSSYKTLFNTIQQGGQFSQETINSISGLSDIERQLMSNSLKAGASVDQFKDSLEQTSKGAQIAGNIINNILTSAVVALATIAISSAINGLSKLANSMENTAESAKKLRDSFDSAKKTADSNLATFDKLTPRLKELSKGVDSFGHNLSLTDEDYEEFKTISQTIADMSPNLIQGYNDQGQAIVDLTGTVKDLRAEYEKAQAAAYSLMITGKDENGKSKIGTLIQDYKNTFNNPNLGGILGMIGGGSYYRDLSADDAYTLLKELRDNTDGTRKEIYQAVQTFIKQNPEYDSAELVKFIEDNKIIIENDSAATLKSINSLVNAYESTKNAALNEFKNSVLNGVLRQEGSDFYNLSEDAQSIVSIAINNIEEATAKDLADKGEGAIYAYVQDQIDLVGSLEKNITDRIKNIDVDTPFENIQDLIKEILDLPGFNEENPLVIYLERKAISRQEKQERINNKLLGNLSSSEKSKIELDKDYNEWLSSLEDEEIDLVLNAAFGPDSFSKEDLEKYLKDLQTTINNTPLEIAPNISESIRDINTQLKPYFDSLGELYLKIFEDGKFNFDNIDTESLANLEQQFNNIAEDIQADLGDAFDASIVEKFFSDLKDVTYLDDVTQATQAAQTAVNNFASAWFNNTQILKDLNPETAKYLQRMMELAGIQNSQEIVQERLNASLQVQDYEIEALAKATEDMKGKSFEATEQFLQEAQMSNLAKVQLANLVAQEVIFSNTDLNISDKIAKLSSLAAAYMGAAAQASFLNKVSNTAAGGHGTISAEAAWEQVVAEFSQLEVDFFKEAPEVAGSAGSSAGEEFVDEFEEALKVLDDMKANDLLSDKQYLDQKYLLIKDMYAKGKLSAEDYFKHIHSWLRETLDLYNKVISDVTKLLDREIKKLNKERDERIKAIEEERDAELSRIDEEIKAQEKKIKLKQKEIDELQKANEKRKQELDLQKALYDMERARNQRTLLQYQEGADGKGQLVYRPDSKALKDARENVEEQQYQKRLSILENELELLEKSRDALNEQREAIENHYQELIDETNKYYDEAIKRIEEYKEHWESLAEAEENALLESRLASLGISIEDILNLDEGIFDSFKDLYLGLLNDIYNKNDLMQQSLSGAWGDLPSYMDATSDAMERLNRIDLSSFERALQTLNTGIQSLTDLNPDLWPSSLDETADGYGDIGIEAQNAGDAATSASQGAGEAAKQAGEDAKIAVGEVINSISGGDPKLSDNTSEFSKGDSFNSGKGNLTSALESAKEISNLAIGSEQGVKGDFDTANESIMTATTFIDGFFSKLKEYTSDVYTIKIQTQMTGYTLPNLSNGSTKPFDLNGWNDLLSGKTKYFGTVGTAFYDGYPGLNSPEYSALRSEYGQPELTVYPNGTYELTTTPTLSDLPKDTVIFNEEQTKRILKNSVTKNLKGKAFANGTPYLPLQDVMPDKAAIFDKFEANITENLSKMKNDISEMTSNVREITRTITNNQINNNSGSTVNVGDINVTCPGVTEAEVARNLGAAIRSELNGVVSGMALRANQLAMRR